MRRLAIKGHATRGEEVIEILEMLGGQNYSHYFLGKTEYNYYYIGNYSTISCIPKEKLNDLFITFTLEEFIEKFPYKVGDKVKVPYEDGRITGNELYEYKIIKIKWDDLESTIKYGLPTGDEQCIEYYSIDNLNIWNKKETMEEIIIDTIKENEDRYRIHVNYQFDIEVDEGEYYVVRRKPQYPKTYDECCKVLNISNNGDIVYSGNWVYGGEYIEKSLSMMRNFQKLLICRDAYWKIAGDEMGLGKPWEPDFKDDSDKYFICYLKDEIWRSNIRDCNRFLVFPTEKIRDEFYENFKDLIKECKELL